jgi:hypothetical protein
MSVAGRRVEPISAVRRPVQIAAAADETGALILHSLYKIAWIRAEIGIAVLAVKFGAAADLTRGTVMEPGHSRVIDGDLPTLPSDPTTGRFTPRDNQNDNTKDSDGPDDPPVVNHHSPS